MIITLFYITKYNFLKKYLSVVIDYLLHSFVVIFVTFVLEFVLLYLSGLQAHLPKAQAKQLEVMYKVLR